MASSVSELLLAANSKAKRSSIAPLLDLLDTGIQGYQTGQGIAQGNQRIRENHVDIATKIVQLEQAKRKAEFQKKKQQEYEARREQEIVANRNQAGVKPSPSFPYDKLVTQFDEDGNISETQTIELPKEPNNYDEILARKFNRGEITLEQYADLKAKAQGIPPSLRYTQEKDRAEKIQGKQLPPANVLAVNEGRSVAKLLPEVEEALKNNEKLFGPVSGRVGSANPYATQSQTVDARMRTASQSFGRFMEGGVLRKEDEEKYRKMFPQLSDTPEVARNKLSIVRRMLAQQYEGSRQSLGESGYDVSGLGELEIPDSIFDKVESTGAEIPKVGDTFQGLKVKSVRRKK